MKNHFPSTNQRQKRNDEIRSEGIIDKLKKRREMKKEGPQEGLAPHFCRAKLRPGWVMCYAPLNLAHDFSQHSRSPIGP